MFITRKWRFIFFCLFLIGYLLLRCLTNLTASEILLLVVVPFSLVIVQHVMTLHNPVTDTSHEKDNSTLDGIKLLLWGFVGFLILFAFVLYLEKGSFSIK